MTACAAQANNQTRSVRVRCLGIADYESSWQQMRRFTDARTSVTIDEIWLLQHPPVYTLGQAGRENHLHDTGNIPVVRSDRGGQVTYHGPGQLIAYLLLDLRRLDLGVSRLVRLIESALIDALGHWGIAASRRKGAPGVYVGDAKIAALGLRVRRRCTYHGLALNVNPDLGAFARIDPCGYPDLAVTSLQQMMDPTTDLPMDEVAGVVTSALTRRLGLERADG